MLSKCASLVWLYWSKQIVSTFVHSLNRDCGYRGYRCFNVHCTQITDHRNTVFCSYDQALWQFEYKFNYSALFFFHYFWLFSVWKRVFFTSNFYWRACFSLSIYTITLTTHRTSLCFTKSNWRCVNLWCTPHEIILVETSLILSGIIKQPFGFTHSYFTVSIGLICTWRFFYSLN